MKIKKLALAQKLDISQDNILDKKDQKNIVGGYNPYENICTCTIESIDGQIGMISVDQNKATGQHTDPDVYRYCSEYGTVIDIWCNNYGMGYNDPWW